MASELQTLFRASNSQVNVARGVIHTISLSTYSTALLYGFGVEFMSYDLDIEYLPKLVERADVVDMSMGYQDGLDFLRREAEPSYVGYNLIKAFPGA
jgi:hypothetical protein